MGLLLVALGLFIYLRYESQLNSQIDQDLRSRTGDVAALVRQADRGSLREAAHSALITDSPSSAQILTPAGRVFDASSPQLRRHRLLSGGELRRAVRGELIADESSSPGVDGPTRLLTTPVQAKGRQVVVVVGTSLDDRDDALHSLLVILLIGGPAALLLASLVGYAATAAALRPVDAMRRRAAAISATERGERLPLPAARDELRRLAETLNGMLARLEAALERERRFVDDASHELRTPLALHKAELELALRYGESADELRASISSAADEVDRLIQLAEDLLVVARLEEGQMELQLRRVEVGPLLDSLRERFRSRAEQLGRGLSLDAADGLEIEGDRVRLERALTNLVDNALRHGGGEVRLWSQRRDGAVELHVSDHGRGMPSEFIDRAFERFSRPGPGRGGSGAGLGLAIVDAIARAHRGRAEATNLPDGGADVWIQIPAAQG